MKFTDIKQMSTSELTKKKESLAGELFQAKMKNVTGQLGNPVQIRFIRRDLARIETAIHAQASKAGVN